MLVTITIHDELVFEIREEGAGEVVEVIEEIMVDKAAEPLGWQIPLKVDVEFGEDWTVPYNLTEMAWNQGGGKWSERWIKAFPNHYQNYLSCGGEAVDGSAPKVVEKGTPIREVGGTDTGIRTPDRISPHTPEREGASYIFRVKKLTANNAAKLARIVHRCTGKGVDTVFIRDADDNDLLGGPVKVAYEEFRLIADYERLR